MAEWEDHTQTTLCHSLIYLFLRRRIGGLFPIAGLHCCTSDRKASAEGNQSTVEATDGTASIASHLLSFGEAITKFRIGTTRACWFWEVQSAPAIPIDQNIAEQALFFIWLVVQTDPGPERDVRSASVPLGHLDT